MSFSVPDPVAAISLRRLPAALVALANAVLIAATTLVGPLTTGIGLVCLGVLIVLALSPISLVTILALLSHVVEFSSFEASTLRLVKWATIGGIAWVALLRALAARRERSTPIVLGAFEKCFLVYLSWAIVCSLLGEHPLASTAEVLRQSALLVVFLIARQTIRTPQQFRVVMRAIMVAVLTACTYSLLVRAGGFVRIAGFFVNSNALGQFLFICLAALLIGRKIEIRPLLRQFYLFTLILTVGCILLTWSRTSWGASFILLITYLVLQKRKKILLAIAGLIVVGGLAFISSQYFNTIIATAGRVQFGTTHRVTLWRFGSASAFAHPLFGRGFMLSKGDVRGALPISGLGEAYTLAGSDLPFNPHNYYILVLLSTGIPGLIILVVLLTRLFKTHLLARRLAQDHIEHYITTVAIAFLAGALFVGMFEMGPLAGSGSYANYTWIILGAVAAVRHHGIRF